MEQNMKHVGFRFAIDDIELLKGICKNRGEDMSDFVRRATKKELANLGYMTFDQKKALGVI